MVKLKLDAIKGGSPIKKDNAVKTSPKKASTPPVNIEKSTESTIMQSEKTKLMNIESVDIQPEENELQPEGKKATSKISLNSIKKSQQKDKVSNGEKKKTEKKNDIIKKTEVFPIGASCELTNIELFPAYTSKFKKKQGGLLQEIKKLKRMERTNKFFISVLIGSTIAGISLLFIFAPEKHNLDNYKTSLLESYNKIQNSINSSNSIPPSQSNIETENIKPETTPPVEENTIKEITPSENVGDTSHTYTGSIKGEHETQQQYYSRIKQQILGGIED